MEPGLKKILQAIILEARRLLEGAPGQDGDLRRRLAALGIRTSGKHVPTAELDLSPADRRARPVVETYLQSKQEAGLGLDEAIDEYVREAAYTWVNRLLALRCMETRQIIDEIILQKEVYGGRSLKHRRFAKDHPEKCMGDDDGLFEVLHEEFVERARELPLVFAPDAPPIALQPSVQTLKRIIALLSGTERVRSMDPAGDAAFTAPDALGWAYQYWNVEEKDRVFEKVRTKKGAKIEGAEIIPATCIYTEPYMVKFLVQNSLGALWMGMHPESRLHERWEYYVKDADRAAVAKKPVRETTFLDPACGSGHFLIEAFDLLYQMYVEEREIAEPAEICASILERNLYGIDIDERAVQIAALALFLKAKERASSFVPRRVNLVATNIRLPQGKDHLEAFLSKHPDDAPLRPALETIFSALRHADELGSLLQIEEPVERELKSLKEAYEDAKNRPKVRHFWPELDNPVQGELPLGVESHEAWKTRTLTRLQSHFDQDATGTDLSTAFFGRAGSKGLSFVELLNRRYDVVVANPPYMGSKNMGEVVKRYVARQFRAGKRDLYAAFILRCIELAAEAGLVAMVTQHSWMFLRSFADLRVMNGEKQRETAVPFGGVLRETAITVLAHLGPRAFSEIGGEVVNTAMFVLRNSHPPATHRLTSFRLVGPKTPEEKASLLWQALGTPGRSHVEFRPLQARFLPIPQAPICYWLREHFLELLMARPLGSQAEFTDGVAVRSRFLRLIWETPHTSRWTPYAKGGQYGRWAGDDRFVYEWEGEGNRVKAWMLGRYPADKLTLLVKAHDRTVPWASWNDVACGSLGCRVIGPGYLIAHTGPAAHSATVSVFALAAVLQSRITAAILRAIAPTLHFTYRDVMRLPAPSTFSGILSAGAQCCVELKKELVAREPIERAFFPSGPASSTSLVEAYRRGAQQLEATAASLHAFEGICEHKVFDVYQVAGDDLSTVLEETGTPTAWYPLIAGYDELPPLPAKVRPGEELLVEFSRVPRRVYLEAALQKLTDRLRSLYKAGSGTRIGDEPDEPIDEEEEKEERIEGGAYLPIPLETFLEELAQQLEIHPVSVYWLLSELRDASGLISPPELRRFVEGYFSIMVLRVLGHRWPSQVETNDPVPEWAAPSGIMPITGDSEDRNLYTRIRQRIAADFGPDRVTSIEREFQDIVKKPLADWLAADFFKHHMSQFKKRPIAWQLESKPDSLGRKRGVSAGRAPAFSCLVYYHALNENTIPTLRSQYIGPLRGRLETELRQLETLAKRTSEQEGRRYELQSRITELKAFDAILENVARGGFSCGRLNELAHKEPLDRWISWDGRAPAPAMNEAFLVKEQSYIPDLNDGVRVNMAPLQRAGVLAADVLATKDIERAIADRAEWRADERRWCREGKLQRPGWWREPVADRVTVKTK